MTPAEPCKFRTPISRSRLHGASVKPIFSADYVDGLDGQLKLFYLPPYTNPKLKERIAVLAV